MIWYILIFIFCVLVFILDKGIKNSFAKKLLEIFTVVVLAIFSGTRYRLGGWDYGIYEDIFNWAPKLSDFTISTTNVYGTEIGYIFLNTIIKELGFNFYGFTLIHSVVFYFLLYKGLKKLDIDFSFFIVIFLYKSCIFNTFVSMRQSLVIVIFLNALYYLIHDKPLKYVLCILPCLLIHTSSIILLLLIFIRKLNFSKKGMIIYGLIFMMLFLANICNIYKFNPSDLIYDLFDSNATIINKTENYSTSTQSINILSTLENFVIFILIVLLYDKVYGQASKERKIIMNIFLLIIPIVTFCRSFEVMIRFRDYFAFFTPFILYYISLVFHRREKFVFTLFVFILSFVGFYRYVYTYDNGEYALKNYQSYLTKNVSIWGDN